MSKASTIIGFVLGVGVGAVAGYFAAKGHFEGIAQEEIDSVKEVFAKRANKVDRNKTDEAPIADYYHNFMASLLPEDKIDISNSESLSAYQAATNWSTYASYNEERKEDRSEEGPYQISEDEFSEFADYTPLSLTYYSGDDVLTDEMDMAMDDYEDSVGTGFRDLLRTDSVIYIRNDAKKCDYEISLDRGSYSDLLDDRPYLRD